MQEALARGQWMKNKARKFSFTDTCYEEMSSKIIEHLYSRKRSKDSGSVDEAVWKNLRKELETQNLPIDVINEHKELILNYLCKWELDEPE